MKKFDWKKVVVLVVALVLCFTLVACVDTEDDGKKDQTVSIKTFLDELVGGLDGMMKSMGATSDAKHLDITLAATVKEKEEVLADLKVRIAGNFSKSNPAKNEVRVEVNESEKLIAGVYLKDNKVYIAESFSTGELQKLSVDGVASLNIQQYLAELPDLLTGALGSLDIQGLIGGFLTPEITDAMSGVLKVTAKTSSTGGKVYTGELVVVDPEDENGGLKGILPLVGSMIGDYQDIINTVLPTILGLKMNGSNFDPIVAGQTNFPKVSLLVYLAKDTNLFEGVSLGYSFPKEGGVGNDVSVEVGLKDIVINSDSAEVNGDIAVKDFKPGAIKVSAELKVPGLPVSNANGVSLVADFYLQPGIGSVDNTAEEENEVIKVSLTAKFGTQSVPLTAEYKYITIKKGDMIEVPTADGIVLKEYAGDKSYRQGRLYFDIEALYAISGLEKPTVGDSSTVSTKYYKDIDLTDMIFGIMNLNTKTFDVKLDDLDKDSDVKSIKIAYIGAKNYQYYTKYPAIVGASDFYNAWQSSISILDSKGASVGTVTKIEYTAEGRVEHLLIDHKAYSITLPYSTFLKELVDGKAAANATAQLELVRESGKDETVTELKDYEKKPESNKQFVQYTVYNADASKTKTVYVTSVESDSQTVSASTQAVADQILQDKTFVPDRPGMEAKLYISKAVKGAYSAVAINTEEPLTNWLVDPNATSANRNTFYLNTVNETSEIYSGVLFVVYESLSTLSSDEAYATYYGSNKSEIDKLMADNLTRYVQNGTELPLMSSELEIYSGDKNKEFEFNVGELGGLIDMVFDKLGTIDSGKLTVDLTDADSILGMGKYLATHKLFAAQIRMLLANEKDTEAFKTNQITAPYKPYQKAAAATYTGTSTTLKENVVAANKYNVSVAVYNFWAAVYGNMENLPSTWTAEQKTAYGKTGLTAAEKAELYTQYEKDNYAKRVAAADEAYAEARAAMETKAMDFIRGYIGNDKSLDSVTTVYDFLYGDGGLKIEASWAAADQIKGMPLSLTLRILRGTTELASLKVGAQFVEAGKIPPTTGNDWTGAVNVHDTVSVTYKDKTVQVSKVVYELVKVHAEFLGIDADEMVVNML